MEKIRSFYTKYLWQIAVGISMLVATNTYRLVGQVTTNATDVKFNKNATVRNYESIQELQDNTMSRELVEEKIINLSGDMNDLKILLKETNDNLNKMNDKLNGQH
jgi:hypothetical protein